MPMTWLQLTSQVIQSKRIQSFMGMSSNMPVMYLSWRGPTPDSTGYRWRTHWKTAHGHCCYYPEFLTQSVSLKLCSTQGFWPVWGRGREPASAGWGGISCGSFCWSRSRRCSWGNHLRLVAIPPQIQSTLVHCYLRVLWVRRQVDERVMFQHFIVSHSLDSTDMRQSLNM